MSSTSAGKQVTVQGRLLSVWGGNLWKGNPKVDDRTKQPVIDAQTGQPVMEYGFILAFPKHLMTQENFAEGKPAAFYGVAHQEAYSIYPNGVPKDFAWKWRDGDTNEVDKKGIPYNQRIGYKDHWILTCSTRIPFPVFKYEGAYVQITEGVNAGDYVTVQLSIKAHPAVGQSKAGMYLNPSMVLLSQKGDPIVVASRDPSVGFGDAPPMAASWMVPASNQAPANFGAFAQNQGAPQVPAIPGVPTGPKNPVAPEQTAPYYGTLPAAHQPPGLAMGGQGQALQPGYAPAAPQAPAGMPGVPGMVAPQGQQAMHNHGYPNAGVPAAPMQQQGYAQQPVQPQVPGVPGVPGWGQR